MRRSRWKSGTLWLSLAGLGLATFPLGCSSDKPPETPSNSSTSEPGTEPPGTSEAPPPEATAAPGTVKRTGEAGGSGQPDDYTVTEGDCAELGKAYGAVTISDLEAQLSPKLSAKQRAATEKSFEAAGAKMEAQAGDACRKSMAGKVADPAALKCALSAKTAKAFDACLNGSLPPKK